MNLKPLVLGAFFLVACGSSGIMTPTDGGSDSAAPQPDGGQDQAVGTRDLAYTPPRDMGPLQCGAQTCAPGQFCCAAFADGGFAGSCQASCGDGGFPIQCTGPGHCGGNPCCVAVKDSTLSGALCTGQQTDCPPNIDFSGNGMTRLCITDGDCTAGAPGTNFNECCTARGGGLTQKICFSSAFVSFTKGAITCP